MVAGQHGGAEVIKTAAARPAAIALAMALCVIVPVAPHARAAARRAAHPFRPTMLTDQLKAFLIIDESSEIDQVGSGQDNTLWRRTAQPNQSPRAGTNANTRYKPCTAVMTDQTP